MARIPSPGALATVWIVRRPRGHSGGRRRGRVGRWRPGHRGRGVSIPHPRRRHWQHVGRRRLPVRRRRRRLRCEPALRSAYRLGTPGCPLRPRPAGHARRKTGQRGGGRKTSPCHARASGSSRRTGTSCSVRCASRSAHHDSRSALHEGCCCCPSVDDRRFSFLPPRASSSGGTHAATSSDGLALPTHRPPNGNGSAGQARQLLPPLRAAATEEEVRTPDVRRPPHRRGHLCFLECTALTANVHNGGSLKPGTAGDAGTDADVRSFKVMPRVSRLSAASPA